MNMRMYLSVGLVALLAGIGSATVQAAGGTVRFGGSVVESTCSIELGSRQVSLSSCPQRASLEVARPTIVGNQSIAMLSGSSAQTPVVAYRWQEVPGVGRSDASGALLVVEYR
ncbi:type 1 fimbrial protein [Halotalea alkalilenta]|nr:type 1 fimbrial protein [Halotalea alkalilenta]